MMDPIAATEMAATLFMTGLIWFVQIVHYPLYSGIGVAEFSGYQRRHQLLTTMVVGPAMLIEVSAAVWLVCFGPDVVSGLRWASVALLILIWLSTATLQVPAHGSLLREFTSSRLRFLVLTNWIRTVAWSGRSLILTMLACSGEV